MENTKTVPCTSYTCLMHIHILKEAEDDFVQFALVFTTRRQDYYATVSQVTFCRREVFAAVVV